MKVLSFLRNKLMKVKMYISRVQTYVSVINIFMIFYLFLDNVRQKGYFSFDVGDLFLVVAVGISAIIILVGWFEVEVLKGQEKENEHIFMKNPYMVDMKKKVDKIHEFIIKEEGGERR